MLVSFRCLASDMITKEHVKYLILFDYENMTVFLHTGAMQKPWQIQMFMYELDLS